MEGSPPPRKIYDLIASKIREEDFGDYTERVRCLDVEANEGRRRVKGEGRSMYFYDYDNHLFEVHTGTLQERLARYNRRLEPN